MVAREAGPRPAVRGPRRLTWIQVGAHTVDISMGFCGNMSHRTQLLAEFGLKTYSWLSAATGLHASTRTQVATHATFITIVPNMPQLAKSKDITKASSQLHRLHMSTWISDFFVTWDSGRDHRHQNGLWWHLGSWWSFLEVQIKPFLISGLHDCPEPGELMA